MLIAGPLVPASYHAFCSAAEGLAMGSYESGLAKAGFTDKLICTLVQSLKATKSKGFLMLLRIKYRYAFT